MGGCCSKADGSDAPGGTASSTSLQPSASTGSLLASAGGAQLSPHTSANPSTRVYLEEDFHKLYLRRGSIRFNHNAKAGISYLIEHGLLSGAESIAFFLRHSALLDGTTVNEPLNKQRIGEFLGSTSHDPAARALHADVLSAYMRFYSFAGLSLTAALRALLSSFRLPGEAQVIDRLMSAFADAYLRDNPSAFSSSDVAYTLAFAAIMLNTDLHNPSIAPKLRMTLPQFIANMKGVDGGRDVAQPLLASLYVDIATHAIATEVECDVVTFFAPELQGWLLKGQSKGLQRWKRRFFLVTDFCLYYFLRQEDVALASPRCIIPLEETEVSVEGARTIRILPAKRAAPLPLQQRQLKSAKRAKDGSLLLGTSRSLVLQAASRQDRDSWAAALAANTTAQAPLTRLAQCVRATATSSAAATAAGGSGASAAGASAGLFEVAYQPPSTPQRSISRRSGEGDHLVEGSPSRSAVIPRLPSYRSQRIDSAGTSAAFASKGAAAALQRSVVDSISQSPSRPVDGGDSRIRLDSRDLELVSVCPSESDHANDDSVEAVGRSISSLQQSDIPIVAADGASSQAGRGSPAWSVASLSSSASSRQNSIVGYAVDDLAPRPASLQSTPRLGGQAAPVLARLGQLARLVVTASEGAQGDLVSGPQAMPVTDDGSTGGSSSARSIAASMPPPLPQQAAYDSSLSSEDSSDDVERLDGDAQDAHIGPDIKGAGAIVLPPVMLSREGRVGLMRQKPVLGSASCSLSAQNDATHPGEGGARSITFSRPRQDTASGLALIENANMASVGAHSGAALAAAAAGIASSAVESAAGETDNVAVSVGSSQQFLQTAQDTARRFILLANKGYSGVGQLQQPDL